MGDAYAEGGVVVPGLSVCSLCPLSDIVVVFVKVFRAVCVQSSSG